ncbi:MAG: hypothetical protein J5684_04570 [Eubacterium sp.]|nr:hypothetical protein [Eubacterium sp.]
MRIRVNKKVYSEDIGERAFKKLVRRVAFKRPVKGLFVITEPMYEAGIMEIYNYNELLQPFYRKKKRTFNVLGVAKSRESAKQVVCDILDDVYRELGKPDIKDFFSI